MKNRSGQRFTQVRWDLPERFDDYQTIAILSYIGGLIKYALEKQHRDEIYLPTKEIAVHLRFSIDMVKRTLKKLVDMKAITTERRHFNKRYVKIIDLEVFELFTGRQLIVIEVPASQPQPIVYTPPVLLPIPKTEPKPVLVRPYVDPKPAPIDPAIYSKDYFKKKVEQLSRKLTDEEIHQKAVEALAAEDDGYDAPGDFSAFN